MVRKTISVKELQRLVAKERTKAKTAEEVRELERELRQLRAGQSTKLLKRFGRGFAVLAKKGASATGRGIVKAEKFARERGAGEGFDVQFQSAFPRKGKTIIKQRRKARGGRRVIVQGGRTREVFVPGLGTVTQKVKQKSVKQRVKRRPKRRKVIRQRAQQQDNSFFGGLSDLGI